MDISEAKVGHIVCFDKLNGEWEIVAIDADEELVMLQAHPDPSEAADCWIPVADVYYV